MHASVLTFGTERLTAGRVNGRRVVEIGALDVNGSLRPHVEAQRPSRYVGVDRLPGPGVDIVADGAAPPLPDGWADVVICTEVLEHAPDWWAVLSGIARLLAPGGTLLLTTRSPGFPRHDYPADLWRFEAAGLRPALKMLGIRAELHSDPEAPGVFVLGAG